MCINLDHVPLVALETKLYIIAVGELCAPFNGDVVVVVEDHELVETQVTRERERFMAEALHHIAIAAKYVGMMINERNFIGVVAFGEHALSQRHADAIAAALPQGACRGLDARREPDFRMSRCEALPLAKLCQFG